MSEGPYLGAWTDLCQKLQAYCTSNAFFLQAHLSCKQQALQKIEMASIDNFVSIPQAGISVLLRVNILCQEIWLTPPQQENGYNYCSTNPSSL